MLHTQRYRGGIGMGLCPHLCHEVYLSGGSGETTVAQSRHVLTLRQQCIVPVNKKT